MIRLEKRPQPSRAFSLATPVLAVLATMFFGGLLFMALGLFWICDRGGRANAAD